MTVRFRYAIGNIVTHKAMVQPASHPPVEAQRFVIVERRFCETSGGVDRYYSVRIIDVNVLRGSSVVKDLFQFVEEEFVPQPRDPIRFLRGGWWRDWLEDAAVPCCDFRCTPPCEQPVQPGQTACEFHVAYRAKLSQLRRA